MLYMPKDKGSKCAGYCCLFCNPLAWPSLLYRTILGFVFDLLMCLLGNLVTGCWACGNCKKWKHGCCMYRDIYYDSEKYGNGCCTALCNTGCCVPITLGPPRHMDGCRDCCCYPLTEKFKGEMFNSSEDGLSESKTCFFCVEGSLISY